MGLDEIGQVAVRERGCLCAAALHHAGEPSNAALVVAVGGGFVVRFCVDATDVSRSGDIERVTACDGGSCIVREQRARR